MAAKELEILERQTFAPGKIVFSEGDRGGRAFIVERGLVELFTRVEGRKVVYGTAGENCLFGEMALIDDTVRIATAVALKSTVCIIIPERLFNRKFEAADPFMRALVKVLVTNLRRSSGLITDQTQRLIQFEEQESIEKSTATETDKT